MSIVKNRLQMISCLFCAAIVIIVSLSYWISKGMEKADHPAVAPANAFKTNESMPSPRIIEKLSSSQKIQKPGVSRNDPAVALPNFR